MANYVDPTEFMTEILKSKESGELTRKAVDMLQLIAEGASKKLKYKDEEDRKDCIAFAMLDVVKYWRSYNPEKSKYPFAYYTQMIIHGFAKGWKKLHPLTTVDKVSLDHENLYNF